ncbi:phospholipase domain-containing protein [Streptomyces sp. CBMA123]|uniref:phospholipase domain-containing protein n=1 Tax=Streptomyces sp. CBMA123 TaxID=1896313 RepID=UPI001661D034|nr:phospholipase domain-containing protein [Streptomyces sp. CBMA123]
MTVAADTRPARALPYDLVVNEEETDNRGQLHLDLENRGEAGAWLYVYDRTAPAAAPRRYAVSGGDTLTDYWTLPGSGRYHLAVHGPNGSLQEFEGEAGTELVARFDPRGTSVHVRNNGPAPRTVSVADAYAKGSARTRTLRPGASVQLTFDVDPRSRWYDVSVTAPGTPVFRRRWAGHLESGRPGTSDPGPR